MGVLPVLSSTRLKSSLRDATGTLRTYSSKLVWGTTRVGFSSLQTNLQTEVATFRILEKLISSSPLNHRSGREEVAVSISPMPNAQSKKYRQKSN